jgi:hypothetical protein
MRLQLDEGKKWLNLQMVQRVQYFLKVVGKQFILYQHLFLLKLMIEEGLMMVEEVKILCCLVVEMLCLVRLVLMVEVNCQIHQ